jgi:hypothetical protein
MSTRKKFNIEKLKHGETRKKFEEELKKSLNQKRMNELNCSEHCTMIKKAMLDKSENILGLSQRKHARDWITEETWNEIKTRRTTKQKLNSADDTTKLTLLTEYSEINKRVKRYARHSKRTWADKLVHKAQLASESNNAREPYQITKRLAGKPSICNQTHQREKWTITYIPAGPTDQMAIIFQEQPCSTPPPPPNK